MRSGGRHIAGDDTASVTFGRMRGWLTVPVGVLLGLTACEQEPNAAACYGVCGEGTECVAGKCVIAQAGPEPEPEPEAKGKKKRRRRRLKGGSAPSEAVDDGFKPVDDSNVPGYDPKATKTMDLAVGTERLGDRVVNQHLGRLEPKFNKCIETSAMHYDGDIKGELDFVLSIKSSGKVGGVTVKGSKSLRDSGVVPCVRKVVYGHRFPSFDGATMGVDYSFKVN